MKPDDQGHLTPEQLNQAVVDRQDLTPDVGDHLAVCDQCQRQVQGLAQDLSQLGRMSKTLAPKSMRRIVLPVDPPEPWYRRKWHLKPALGMAVAALLLVAIVWWAPLGQRSPEQSDDLQRSLQIWQDGSFMGEVNALIENALPEAYQALLVEPGPALDDTLIDWMVPLEEPQTVSRRMMRKDVRPC